MDWFDAYLRPAVVLALVTAVIVCAFLWGLGLVWLMLLALLMYRVVPRLTAAESWTGLMQQGELAARAGRLADAEAFFRPALDKARSAGAADVLVRRLLHRLVEVCWKNGRLAEADEFGKQAVLMTARSFGKTDRQLAETLEIWAVVLRDRGELEEAEAACRKALHIRGKELFADPERVDTTRRLLADVLLRLGRPADAEQVHAALKAEGRRPAAASEPACHDPALISQRDLSRELTKN